MIQLRNLQKKDASLMLEWMHDEELQKCFQKKMGEVTMEEAIAFCTADNAEEKIENGKSLHYAIVNEQDEYLGTISLKNINLINKNAEYAISMRRCAQGTGAAFEATRLLLKKGFRELGMHRIYLNVLKENTRAIRFYEKSGFTYEGELRDCICMEGEYRTLKWYSFLHEEYEK